ncbi:MAG: hypothetical protein KAT77_02530 [Nanoarchaeota archaeon]|nr:hypothetical protein [Nanoarchaeota archaeon]
MKQTIGTVQLRDTVELSNRVEKWFKVHPSYERDNHPNSSSIGAHFDTAIGFTSRATRIEVGYCGFYDVYRLRCVVHGRIKDEFLSVGDEPHFNWHLGLPYSDHTEEDHKIKEFVKKKLNGSSRL